MEANDAPGHIPRSRMNTKNCMEKVREGTFEVVLGRKTIQGIVNDDVEIKKHDTVR